MAALTSDGREASGEGIELIRPDWPVPVHAGFTTRQGGVSQSPYNTLNLALHVEDDPAAVHENRRRLVAQAGLPEEPRWLRQVHGTRVVHAEEVERDVTEADAVWSDRPGQVCAVLVADCMPILLASADGGCVAAVHAGWRGLASGVIQAAVAALPVPSSGLHACIGPCIGPTAYEVGPEVIEQLQAVGVVPVITHGATARTKSSRECLDLVSTASRILEKVGVTELTSLGRCSANERHAFYSHRRCGATGRLSGFIVAS
ncbi:peptidoglycan editing factor PgeF [Spiribacter salinus]|uniref:peptidoglycan editing factor PgeF n=1 Tax=Spiribacter salinus TaxID=1335746 RepID=UPI0028F43B79|nr:peptidoglycan editing factor PgeF [Spiribacter salinus]